MNLLSTAPSHSVIIADESAEFTLGRESLSPTRIKLVKNLMRIREKNFMILFVIPDVSMLEKYLRSFRCATFLETKMAFDRKTELVKKGYVKLYTRRQLQKMFSFSQKTLKKMSPRLYDTFDTLEGDELWTQYRLKKREYLGMRETEGLKTGFEGMQQIEKEHPEYTRAEKIKEFSTRDGITERHARRRWLQYEEGHLGMSAQPTTKNTGFGQRT